MVAISFGVNFGPRYETPLFRGVSHLIRSAACFSTKSRNRFELQIDLQTRAIDFNVSQYRDLTVYNMTCAKQHSIDALRIFTDVLTRPMLYRADAVSMLNDVLKDDDWDYLRSCTDVVLEDMIHQASFGQTGLGSSAIYKHNRYFFVVFAKVVDALFCLHLMTGVSNPEPIYLNLMSLINA